MTFAGRRWRNISIIIVVAAILVGSHAVYDVALYDTAFLSGWLLLASVVFLSLYSARKKITMLPIGGAPAWLQIHVYLGLISIVLFVLHVGWRVPDGWFEATFATVFVLVAGSGIIGAVLCRTIPKRLTQRGEEVLFDRIPVYRTKLKDDAEAVIVEASRETKSSTVRNFYIEELASFMNRPGHVLPHLFASNRALYSRLAEIDYVRRYLNAQEGEYVDQLRWLVTKKDDLDFHYALQGALKAWLFIHVPLTFSLLVMAAVHLVLAYAFSGGVE